MPKLTWINQLDILSKYNQIDIFLEYINKFTLKKTTKEELLHVIAHNGKISSPLRTDDHPSCGFRYSGKPRGDGSKDYNLYGTLRIRDFTARQYNISSRIWGDVFDFVGFIIDKNPKNGEQFQDIILHIERTMDGYDDPSVLPFHNNPSRNKASIQIQVRDWDKSDVEYWLPYHLDIRFLHEHFVYPVMRYWINDKLNPYRYKVVDPCYAYYSGTDKFDRDIFQLYFPLRNRRDIRPRFIGNVSELMNTRYLFEDTEIFILVKSNKDLLVIKKLVVLRIIPHCALAALPSETYKLPEKKLIYLTTLYSKRFVHTDCDTTGLASARYYKEYGFQPLIIRDKDVAAYIRDNGIEGLQCKWIEQLKT